METLICHVHGRVLNFINEVFATFPTPVSTKLSIVFTFAVMDGSSQTELERRQSSSSSSPGGGGGEHWSMLTVALMGAALTLAVITTVVGLIARMGRRPPMGGRGRGTASCSR